MGSLRRPAAGDRTRTLALEPAHRRVRQFQSCAQPKWSRIAVVLSLRITANRCMRAAGRQDAQRRLRPILHAGLAESRRDRIRTVRHIYLGRPEQLSVTALFDSLAHSAYSRARSALGDLDRLCRRAIAPKVRRPDSGSGSTSWSRAWSGVDGELGGYRGVVSPGNEGCEGAEIFW
jgi:hypothetical protein